VTFRSTFPGDWRLATITVNVDAFILCSTPPGDSRLAQGVLHGRKAKQIHDKMALQNSGD
jgi:hypothetical protein